MPRSASVPAERCGENQMVCHEVEDRVFHKILKSGCKAEAANLRTAQRLTNLIALFCILAWRVF